MIRKTKGEENMETTNQGTKRYCTECGAELEAGNQVCPDCGTKVNVEAPKTTEKTEDTVDLASP